MFRAKDIWKINPNNLQTMEVYSTLNADINELYEMPELNINIFNTIKYFYGRIIC